MLRNAIAIGFAIALAACTTPSNQNASSPPPNGGETFLGVISTPFVIAFKIPVCVASAAVAASIVGVSLIAGDEQDQRELRRGFGEGLEENCGPPWGVNP